MGYNHTHSPNISDKHLCLEKYCMRRHIRIVNLGSTVSKMSTSNAANFDSYFDSNVWESVKHTSVLRSLSTSKNPDLGVNTNKMKICITILNQKKEFRWSSSAKIKLGCLSIIIPHQCLLLISAYFLMSCDLVSQCCKTWQIKFGLRMTKCNSS